MPRRHRPTHFLNAFSYELSDSETDTYGVQQKERTAVLSGEPVRLVEKNNELVRIESGEKEESNPQVVGSFTLAKDLEVGMEVELIPYDGYYNDEEGEEFEVKDIQKNWARASKSISATVELER